MIATLINLIETVLTGVSEIAFVYGFNVTKFDGFPAAVFIPQTFDNTYLTTAENRKGYAFRLVILQEAEVKNKDSALDILVNAVDAVIAAFDTNWDQGTTVEGHRIWCSAGSGSWSIDKTQNGELLVAEVILTFNVVTNI